MVLRKSNILCFTLLCLLLFPAVFAASSLPSFCKCIVGANYTIISLNNGRAAPNSGSATSNTAPRTCSDCNRQFCLGYNLPIVQGAKEEDISTQCFQRDSYKDRVVVYTFIILTVGLLVYAALRPWIDSKLESFQERRTYVPVGSNQ